MSLLAYDFFCCLIISKGLKGSSGRGVHQPSLRKLMVHAQQDKDSNLRKWNRETKKTKSFEGSSSKSRIVFQDKYMFKKRLSNHVPYNL